MLILIFKIGNCRMICGSARLMCCTIRDGYNRFIFNGSSCGGDIDGITCLYRFRD